jgi:lipoate---protein ligase
VPAPDAGLRVLDFGRASPLRSQTLWHAVARGVSAGSPPTLSFVRPSAPYVCVGYHHSLDEVDLDACRRAGLPVYRRMVGGGPVYLDDGQLFFQIALPMSSVPPRRDSALRLLLEPAIGAFRAAGVPAELDKDLEIVVGDRKVCGHGAGQIEEAVVVVGNLIERFDHEAASAILRAPSPEASLRLLGLMRRYVAATPAHPGTFIGEAVNAYARCVGLPACTGELTDYELAALDELDRQFEDPDWRRGPDRPAKAAWQAKVRAGVSVLAVEHAGSEVVAGLVGGRLDGVRVSDAALNGAARRIEGALQGCLLAEAEEVLVAFGEPGRRVAAALAKVERRGT